MDSGNSEQTTVLVADDEVQLADLYTEYLEAEYDVVTAYGGEPALEHLEDPSVDVDVALLDRRMPDRSGDKVLAVANERGYDCRVALVTAVDPGFDIIDMGCDEYLVKPVEREQLLDAVDRLDRISEFSDKHQQLTTKKLKRNLLEVEKSRPELQRSDRFDQLTEEIQSLEAELREIGQDLSIADVRRHI